MKNTRFAKKENGAVGIGTLIVFIAMVLVAAIAAAVLINTSGQLQDRAQQTGSQATEDVSGGIKVQHMECEVEAGAPNEVTSLRFYLALHSGTSAVDLQSTLVVHLSWIDQDPLGTETGVVDCIYNAVPGDTFSVVEVVDPHASYPPSLDQDSLVYIQIDIDTLTSPPTNGALNGLDPASSGQAKFVISTGMTPTLEGFDIPGSFPGVGWIPM